MAGLADFGYLYNFTNPQSAFASRLPVDPNAPKEGGLPTTMDLNLTGLKTFRDNQEAIVTQAATAAKNNAIIGESLPVPKTSTVPVIDIKSIRPDESAVQSSVLGVAQADINAPPEPTVTIFKPDGTKVVVPVSQRAQVEAQIEAQNRTLINEEIKSKDQAAIAAEQAYRERAKVGLRGPTNYAPRSEEDKASEIAAEVQAFMKGQAYTKAETEKVIYNGREITKAAYDKLVGMSPILAEAINDKKNKTIKLLVDTATQAGVDPKIAVVTTVMESSLNTDTGDSPVGAKGLMQVMPGTFEGTRLKFLNSSDPNLRALAESLPSYAVVGSRRPNSDKIDYSWNSKVKLTDEQQVAAGVLYLRSLKDDYPERPDNVIFAMYHAGPGHRAFDEGKIPDTLGDRGVANGVAFGMFTSDYSTAAIGLYNQLALAGFGEKPLPKPNTTAGLKVDPAQPADQDVVSSGKAGVVPQNANQNNANQNPVSLGNPTLPSTPFMLKITPAQSAADLRLAEVNRKDVVAELQATNDLREKHTRENDFNIVSDYQSKAAKIIEEIRLAQIGRNADVITKKRAELDELTNTTNEKRQANARKYELDVVATNRSNNSTIRLHDLEIRGLVIQEAIVDFSVNGNPKPLNSLLREVGGSDTILQPLANGDFAVLVRQPDSPTERNEKGSYVYQTDKSGNITQLNKAAALDFVRQIIDSKYAAAVTAAVAENTKNVSEKMLDAQIALQKVAEEKKIELFNNVTQKTYEAEFKRLEQTGQIKIDKTPDGKMMVIPEGQTGEFIYGFVINPEPPPVMVNGVEMPGSLEPQTVTFRRPGLTPKQ